MTNEFHLLIDDFRDYDMDHIARTADDGRKALLSYPVTHLYMDHDLGEYGDTAAETGYDVITWALEHGTCPPNVQFVTANPVGRDNMAAALENAGYTKDGVWYRQGIIIDG